MSLTPRLFALLLCASPALAQGDQLAASYPLAASKFAQHPSQPRLYASVPNQNAVAVIDTQSLALVSTVFVGSNPRGLALSPDGATLFVATSGATQLARLDTSTLQLLTPIPLPTLPSDVEVGLNGIAFVTPAPQTTGIMQVDTLNGQYLGEFSLTVFVYGGGMLEISPDRATLYFANVGLSPGTLAAFDVSTATPALLYKNPHGALGSNGQDLALSGDGSFISYACGGGNFGYDIFKISTAGFGVLGSFLTGPYPREVVFDPAGTRAFAVHTAGHIDVFDAQTFLSLREIATTGESSELAVDATGRYLFAAFDTELRVWDLAEAIGSPFCGGVAAACPCGNTGGPVQGCKNSAAKGGVLTASGSTSLAAGNLELASALLPPLKAAVLVASPSAIAPLPFGNGSLCLGGAPVRLAAGVTSAAGALDFGPGLSLAPTFSAGQTGHFQVWHRDGGGPCGGATNFSSGLSVTLAP
jgi:DNA-binding beta-propeller fold protein YncE